MINPQWLELLMSRTIFHGPKDVRAIKVRLYVEEPSLYSLMKWLCDVAFLIYAVVSVLYAVLFPRGVGVGGGGLEGGGGGGGEGNFLYMA